MREFGETAVELVPVFLKIEGILGKIFYADKNYYGFQSIMSLHSIMMFAGLALQLTSEPGTPFPTPQALVRSKTDLTSGSHIPSGHQCAGAEAMVREMQEALSEAKTLLSRGGADGESE